jgi:hypothetical protein
MKSLAALCALAVPLALAEAQEPKAPPAKPAAAQQKAAPPAPQKAAPPAPPAAQPPADDATTRARAHFRKGSELYKQARYREAIGEFEAAYKLRPHGIIHFNLAQCHERLGDIPAALQAYHEYLRAVPQAEDRSTVLAAMANLEARLGASGVQQLLVYSEPSAAEVLVNGQSKGRTPMALVLPHGSHAVTLLKQGYRTVTRQVVLSPQSSLALDLVLPRLEAGELAGTAGVGAASTATPTGTATPTATGIATPTPTGIATPTPTGTATARPITPVPLPAPPTALAPPPPAPRPVAKGGRVWTWVAAGAAVAAAGAGVYFYSTARDARSDLYNYPAGTARATELDRKVKSNVRSANVMYGIAGGLGAGAGALFFIEGSF